MQHTPQRSIASCDRDRGRKYYFYEQLWPQTATQLVQHSAKALHKSRGGEWEMGERERMRCDRPRWPPDSAKSGGS